MAKKIIICFAFCLVGFFFNSNAKYIDTLSFRDAIVSPAMTPNGDGKDEYFVIHNINEFPSNKLMIFDKSGSEVYRKEYYNNDWDGKLDGKTVADGMYYYVFGDGKGSFFTGYIQISR